MINFEEFSKIEVRIGKIVEAERVPETDKLIRMQVDLGEESLRQIVSGIAEWYGPEDLIGKLIPIVANLEPRKFKGVESQGMIMAAKDETGKPILLHPADEVSPGASVV